MTDLPYKSIAESERQHKGRCILLTYETGHLAQKRDIFSLGPMLWFNYPTFNDGAR